MKTLRIRTAIFAIILGSIITYAKTLTNDPLTGLPLIPATVYAGNSANDPVNTPDGMVCKSKMRGNFYSLYNTTVDSVVVWYSSHLNGFKKIQNADHTQTAFINSTGTIVVIVTGRSNANGGNANSVAYESYQPGISEKTIGGLTDRHIVCN